ncbi:MAG: acyl--CoA ligase [Lachnospiraceae bacterium]|nr:acyl--CoA ligase [Lachnospiraceae bacterium]
MFRSIVEAVAYYGEKNPEKLCIADEIEALSYQEVRDRIGQIAEKFQAMGIRKEDKVAMECTQDARFLICGLACQLIGAVFVPLEKNVSKERVQDIIEVTEPKCFICKGNYEVKVTILKEEEFFDFQNTSVKEWSEFPEAEAVAEILYSTGTTGKAKGIVITNQNNVAVAENIIFGTEMAKDNVELVPMPMSHSHALRTCYANMLNGSAVVVIDGVMRVKKVFELIDKYQVNAFDLSPSGANVLMKLAKKQLQNYCNRVRFIEIGSAVLEEGLKEELCQVFKESRLYNFYGSTEAGRTCILDFNREKGRPGCIGKPTKNARFIVTDQDRNEIQSNRNNPGLLAIAGTMNMKEYLKAPELTQQTMQQGFIYTSDLGYIDEEGFVYVLGRMDDVINYNGIKIAPEEIESFVHRYHGVTDCACVPVKDAMCGQVPKVFVSVEDKGNFDTTGLLKFLSEHIEANKQPKKVEIIDKIPRTSNGKILRRELRKET